MDKACLVTGKSGPLLSAIVRGLSQDDNQVLVTRSGQMDLGDIDEGITSVVSWNRRSALSARSVLLHASNLAGRLDHAVVIFAPADDATTYHESSIVGIEDRIDAEVKGYLFMLRETLSLLVKQGSGTVALVMQHPPADLLTPLQATTVGAFVSLADAVYRYYQNEPITILRFTSESPGTDDYSDFIISRLHSSDSSGTGGSRRATARRWLTFPSGPSLFGRSRG